ncbi:MAG TPA: pyridoxal-phosphate dependent enzyme [Clostridia bacterium]
MAVKKKGNADFLLCDSCGRETDIFEKVNLCPHCGGLLEVHYDIKALKQSAHVFKEYRRDSIWRYRDFFPGVEDNNIVSLGEGGTPLTKSIHIGPKLGIQNLYFKNDTIMPTGSFKDRGFSLAVSYAKEIGVKKGFTYSSGNAGVSFAAYSSRGGLNSMILVEYLANEVKKTMIRFHSDKVAVMEFENFQQVTKMLEYAVKELGLYQFVNFINPIRHEAMKTYAYEIYGELNRVPDVMIHPVGTGGGLWGAWKGYNELCALGVTDRLPRMIGVQPECVAWIKQAILKNAKYGEAYGDSEKTIAQSICGNAPIQDGRRLISAIVDSGGTAVGVSDEEILEAMLELAGEGISAEPASASSVAAFKKLVEGGKINSRDTVVCIITATGLKQASAVALAAGVPTYHMTASPDGILATSKKFLEN